VKEGAALDPLSDQVRRCLGLAHSVSSADQDEVEGQIGFRPILVGIDSHQVGFFGTGEYLRRAFMF
jgi:hypothetical protein